MLWRQVCSGMQAYKAETGSWGAVQLGGGGGDARGIITYAIFKLCRIIYLINNSTCRRAVGRWAGQLVGWHLAAGTCNVAGQVLQPPQCATSACNMPHWLQPTNTKAHFDPIKGRRSFAQSPQIQGAVRAVLADNSAVARPARYAASLARAISPCVPSATDRHRQAGPQGHALHPLLSAQRMP